MSITRIIDSEKCILVVVDMQDTLLRVINESEKIIENTVNLVKAADVFAVPVINTVQYPIKLGTTNPGILAEMPEGIPLIAKTSFSCMDGGVFEEQLEICERKQVILCGVETHICVNQTAHDLLDAGYEVHVISDAVSSRTAKNHIVGIEKMRQSGCIISSLEMAIYEMAKDASGKEFRQVHQLLK